MEDLDRNIKKIESQVLIDCRGSGKGCMIMQVDLYWPSCCAEWGCRCIVSHIGIWMLASVPSVCQPHQPLSIVRCSLGD